MATMPLQTVLVLFLVCITMAAAVICDGKCCPPADWMDSGCGTCSKTCGPGTKTCFKIRLSTQPPMPPCGESTMLETRACNLGDCTEPQCREWGDWKCNCDCDGWERCTRTREGSYGPKCPRTETKKERCYGVKCCPPTAWVDKGCGPCSKTCGPGEKTCTKERISTRPPHPPCGGDKMTEKKLCNGGCCPVDGGWCGYGSYGDCSKTCGSGTRHRSRKCECPSPKCGGNPCSGSASSTDSCNKQCCSDCHPWSSWHAGCGECTCPTRRHTCKRRRTPGKCCPGSNSESREGACFLPYDCTTTGPPPTLPSMPPQSDPPCCTANPPCCKGCCEYDGQKFSCRQQKPGTACTYCREDGWYEADCCCIHAGLLYECGEKQPPPRGCPTCPKCRFCSDSGWYKACDLYGYKCYQPGECHPRGTRKPNTKCVMNSHTYAASWRDMNETCVKP